jgi:hypothetical protein
MMAIKAAFPNFYKNQTEVDDAIALWSEMLADDASEFIAKAVKHFIKNDTSGFPPSIGQIRTLAAEIRRSEWEKQQREIDMLPAPVIKGVPMPDEIRVKLEAFKKGLIYG